MKPVIILPEQWDRVWEEIKRREKPSTFLSRNKMREVMGFTNRNHEGYVDKDKALRNSTNDEWFDLEWYADKEGPNTGKVWQRAVHLDFYDEQKRVMFLLKYGDCIGNRD